MPNLVIIDTDILIDVGHKDSKATAYIENLQLNHSLAMSLITQMELIVGCRNKHELSVLNKFLKHFEIIKLNDSISDIAVDLLQQYRLSYGLLIPDALIAATALSLNVDFASKNQRDYKFMTHLKLLPY